MKKMILAAAALALGVNWAAAFNGRSPELAKMESGLRFGEGRMPGADLAAASEERGSEVRAFLKEASQGKQAPMGFKTVEVPSPKPQRHEDWRRERDGTISGLAIGAVATALMYFLAGPMAMSLYGMLGLGGLIGGVVGALIPSKYQGLAVGLAFAAGIAAAALSPAAVAVLGGALAIAAASGAAAVAARVTSEIEHGYHGHRNAGDVIADAIGSGLVGTLIGVTGPMWGGALMGKLLGRRKA